MKKFAAIFCLLTTSLTAFAEPNLLGEFNKRAELNYKQSIYKIISYVGRSPIVNKLNFAGPSIVLPKGSEYLALLPLRNNDLCGIKEENATPGFRTFSIICYDSEGREILREFSKEAKRFEFDFKK